MTWQPFQTLQISGITPNYSAILPYPIQAVRIKTNSLNLDGQPVTDYNSTNISLLFSLAEENGAIDSILYDTFSLTPDNDYLIFSLNSSYFNTPKIGFKILDSFGANNPQWTIEIEIFQFSNLSSINDILNFINSNTNNKIQSVLNALANLDLTGITNMDFTQLLADITTLLNNSNNQLLTDINKAQLLTDINTHSDSNKDLIITNSNSNKTSVITDINAHSDANKDLIITAINSIGGAGGGTPPSEPLKYYLKGDSFNDDSTFNRTLINSNVILDTNTKKYGSSSFYFDGSTGCYLDIPSNDILLKDSYCLEFWMKQEINKNWVNLITLGNALTGITLNGGSFYLSDNYSFMANYGDTNWHHIAITKNSNNETIIYFDGINIFSTTDNISFYSDKHRLGNDKVFFDGFQGWIDSVRLEVGSPKYTTNFDPELDTGLSY